VCFIYLLSVNLNKKTKKMHDGNDEQLLCLLTFKYLAYILEFSLESLKLKFTIYGKHEPKTKSLGKRKA